MGKQTVENASREINSRIVEIFRVNLGFCIYEGIDPNLYSYLSCGISQGPIREDEIVLFQSNDILKNTEVEGLYQKLGLKRPSAEHAIRFCNQRRDLPRRDEQITFYLRPEDFEGSLKSKQCVATLWRDTVYPYNSRRLDKEGIDGDKAWDRGRLFAGVSEVGTIFYSSPLSSRLAKFNKS